MDFPCVKCGLCCKQLKSVPFLKDYDDGNGICRYLVDNLCGIYKNRPLVCNIAAMYVTYFMPLMNEEIFIKENLFACRQFAIESGNQAAQEKIDDNIMNLRNREVKKVEEVERR
jgi:Fe-S-cluster containining protein